MRREEMTFSPTSAPGRHNAQHVARLPLRARWNAGNLEEIIAHLRHARRRRAGHASPEVGAGGETLGKR